MGMSNWIAKVERRNQIVNGKTYFHIISFQGALDLLPKEYVAFEHIYWYWIIMKHNPYIPLFRDKILRADETGLAQKFWDEAGLFGSKEEEPLEALKLEHFAIMFVGNAAGLVLSLAVFAFEKLVGKKKGGAGLPGFRRLHFLAWKNDPKHQILTKKKDQKKPKLF